MLVSITVYYIKKIKNLQDIWSTHLWDCFGSPHIAQACFFRVKKPTPLQLIPGNKNQNKEIGAHFFLEWRIVVLWEFSKNQ